MWHSQLRHYHAVCTLKSILNYVATLLLILAVTTFVNLNLPNHHDRHRENKTGVRS